MNVICIYVNMVLVAVLLSGCVSPVGTSLPGMTTANPQLEKDTLFMVIGMDRAEDKGCNQRKIANSEVIATDSKKAVERWTIDRCGTLFRYGITYTPSPNGGTMIGINPPETVGKAR